MDISKVLKNLIDEYAEDFIANFIELRKYYVLNKYRETIFYGGRFSESLIRGLAKKYGLNYEDRLRRVKDDLKKSLKGRISDFFREVYLEIAYNIYQLRNKKDVAHVNLKVDPSVLDAHLTFAACSTLFSETLKESLRLSKASISMSVIEHVLNDIIRKELPFIEKITENKILVFKGKTALEKILLLLYYTDEWTDRELIFKSLLHEKSKDAIRVALKIGERRGLIAKSDDGMKYKITLKGIKYIEESIIKELSIGNTYDK